jgi:hypothetical protein
MRWWPFVWKSAHKEALSVVQQSRDECWSKYKQEQNANQKLRQQSETIFFEKAGLISIKKELEDEIALLRGVVRRKDEQIKEKDEISYIIRQGGFAACQDATRLEKENQVLRTAMRSLEVANAEQSKAMADLKIELGIAVQAFDTLSDEKAGIEAQMTNSDAEYQRLLATIENLEAALSAANEELVKSAFQISNLEYTISIKNEINHGHTETIEELKKNLSDAKEAVEEINRDRDAKDSCLMRLAEERAVIALAGELAARYGMRITQELADEERGGGVMNGFERINL